MDGTGGTAGTPEQPEWTEAPHSRLVGEPAGLVGLATPYMTPYMNLDPLRLLHGPQTPYTNTHSGARIRTPGKAQVQGMQITQPE